nr:RecName: Full=Putative oxygen-evolving enhancer protein 2; Short=OEE2; AltName: Full=23 kDa subunit of oxygen evolving system of photosystem II; AltName: Full=23 kDa thylakoid membrane protein; AltName: Full=OEC 23 kDa subunit; AltName: Full=PS11 [Pinus strobus]
GEAANVMGAPK